MLRIIILLHERLLRPRRRWGSTEMNPKEIESDVDLITCVGIGRVAGFCEHGNETSDPTKCGAFL